MGSAWPKPMAEWIYETFNAYAERHPWVDLDAIRPKSVVRDMVERYLSFTDYIKELKLERLEGVLLRYLSQSYKLLIQTIPADARTDELEDVIAFLRAALARVDSSLIAEWERLANPTAGTDADSAPPPIDISSDKRAFRARVRAELHTVVRALAREDYDDAIGCMRPPTDPLRPAWTPASLATALEPFLAENHGVTFDIHDIIDVNGENAHPLFKHLRKEAGGMMGDKIKWNFTKFLVDRDGNVISRVAPTTSPLKMKKDIEKVL